MARLIDADVLIAKQASIAKTFARSDAQKSLMGRVMYNTENAPTIDAVPVEWLRKWPKSLRDGAYVRDILRDWQKEQGAR